MVFNYKIIKEPVSVIYLFYDGFDGVVNRYEIDIEANLKKLVSTDLSGLEEEFSLA